MMFAAQATVAQVKAHYAEQGYFVRISADGHVEFRKAADLPWREGRWVSEYVVDERGNVHLT